MFSPQSIPMESMDPNSTQLTPSNRQSNDTDNCDDNVNLSNDNIIYAEEDCSINNNNESSMSESNISYCGIKSNSILSGILNICASAVGAGCFTFPWIISNIGILNTTLIFIVVSCCIYYSLDLLRSFVVDTKYFSFSLMTETTLGKKWLMVYSFSSFVYYLSINISYLSIIYAIFRSFFLTHSTLIGFIFLLVTGSIEIFLCLYTSKIAKINLLSLITMFNFFIIVIVIIYEGFRSSIKYEYLAKKFSTKNLLHPIEKATPADIFFASVSACIKYIYGYSYNCSFPTLIGNLKNVNDSNSKKVHNLSFIIICSTYFIIGLFGYLIKENVPSVLFKEYEDLNEETKMSFSIRIILFLFLFTLIPNRYIIIRDGYKLLIGKDKLTYKKDLLITTLALFFSNAIVFFTEEYWLEIDIFTLLVNIFGGLFGVMISFGLPVINFAAVNGKRKLKTLIGYTITGVFVVIGSIACVYAFIETYNKYKEEEEE